ncbi:hypothetical protein X948_4788 [Burkholderia pseudomallei MSHR5608]|nr:hypothetical protein X948_4788 [Burkholderia pseudomallei MSHR5608]
MPPVACITGAAAQPVPPFAPAPPFSFFAPPEATGRPPPRRGSIAPQLKKNASRAPCAREAKIAAKPPFKHTAPPAIRRRSAAAGPGRHGRNG